MEYLLTTRVLIDTKGTMNTMNTMVNIMPMDTHRHQNTHHGT